MTENLMDSFSDTVKRRRSVRAISDKKIGELKIKNILKTAIMAPSAGGLQSFRIFVVSDKKKSSLAKAAYDQPYVESPLVLVFCTEPKKIKKTMGMRGERLFAVQDATIAASYAQLAAASLDLTSVWVGHFSESAVQRILKTKLKPVVILPIGYPMEKPAKKKSKPLTKIVKII